MTSQIKQELSRLELQHDIKILYVVEGDSRAWGFASTDNDWWIFHPSCSQQLLPV